jgi:hypothetical protein
MLRRVIKAAVVVGAVLGVGVIGAGCLDRPITSANPTTKTNFTTAQQANTIDKVDLLFDIDNSASMGDKETYLALAVPDLVTRLVNPNCVDNTSGLVDGASTNGSCAAFTNSTIEFPPVHNMHIGIISSALGTRGVTGSGAVCDPTLNQPGYNNTGAFKDGTGALSTHEDDQAHLLSRGAGSGVAAETEAPVMDVGGQGFLDWFPPVSANTGKTATGGVVQSLSPQAAMLTMVGAPGAAGTLEGDFALLVEGVHNYGCGIESQLETWYRFLVQPDPYASITITSGGVAQWTGYDQTIIQQRHDFLRPDSLVAIIVLSDENDSEIDVRSVGGSGYLFMDTGFNPPKATGACATNPLSSMCFSCLTSNATTASDPNCKKGANTYSAQNDWGYYINVRHVHMPQKYGFSAQFPLQRYQLGLTSPKVPDRNHEYPSGAGSYQGGTNGDPGDLNCLNPLFAATLPNGSNLDPAVLCQATGAQGPRSANLIFYAHIGGVPHELLQAKPGVEKDSAGNPICKMGTNPADCPQKETLTVADWTHILGNGVATGGSPYDYTGIDPHMIEDYQIGRVGVNYVDGSTETIPMVTDSPTGGGPDPINGGDWQTAVGAHPLPVDREYACIFPLKDANTGEATPRDCSNAVDPTASGGDPLNYYACDCNAVGLSGTQVSPLCGLPNPGSPVSTCSAIGSCSGANDYTSQYYAKAYPTIRELTLAQMMGAQGIISSLCPIHVQNEGGNDPVFGYRPAVTAIVNRLKNALASQCLPQPLHPVETDAGLQVPCLILATIPGTSAGSEATVCAEHKDQGLSAPAADVLATFQMNAHAQWLNAMTGPDPSTLATCEINQISVAAGSSCVGAGATSAQGWCYVTGKAAGSCDTQAILFTPGTPPNGSTVNLQCILENSGSTSDGGGG